jgi:hypothetical protein
MIGHFNVIAAKCWIRSGMTRHCELLLVRPQPEFPRRNAVPILQLEEKILRLSSPLQYGNRVRQATENVFGPG